MALEIRPFAGVSYTDANWRADYADLFNQGVLPRVTGELAVTGTASPLVVAPGTAMIQGFIVRNTTNVNVTVSTPGATTAGRIIIRITYATKTVQIVAKMATGGVLTPPALTQNTTTYEMSLASFLLQNNGSIALADERVFVQFNTQVNPATQLASLIGTAQIADGSITESKIADGNITVNKIADGHVVESKIANGNVTVNKIANGHVTTDKLADGAVTSSKIANYSIHDYKVGERVPRHSYRQGGDNTNWSTPGYSTITPAKIKILSGMVNFTTDSAGTSSGNVVTFPEGFTGTPLIFLTAMWIVTNGSGNGSGYGTVNNVSSTGFTFTGRATGGGVQTLSLSWFAIGTE